MNIPYNKKERTFIWACAYLGVLFVSTIALWWSVLVGDNPLSFKNSEIIDKAGQSISVLHHGQSVGVSRTICSKRDIGVEFFPSLTDKDGLIYPLQAGVFGVGKGCTVKTYGFVVPDLPTGVYTYQGTIRYQASLVGRNEIMTSPALTVRIEP